jgi:hypothetical protein
VSDESAEIATFRVGDRSPVETEDTLYDFRTPHLLVIPIARATAQEIRAIKAAEVEIAYAEFDPLIVLLFRFGFEIPWSDTCFHPLHGKASIADDTRSRLLNEAEGKQRALWTIVAIDPVAHFRVLALRAVSLSPTFTQAFARSIVRSVDKGRISNEQFSRTVRRLYAEYPTTTAFLKNVTHRSIGGA